MSNNIIPLNNITYLDIPIERVLDGAKNELDEAIVIGWDKSGEVYFASSISDGAEVNWLLDKAKLALLGEPQ